MSRRLPCRIHPPPQQEPLFECGAALLLSRPEDLNGKETLRRAGNRKSGAKTHTVLKSRHSIFAPPNGEESGNFLRVAHTHIYLYVSMYTHFHPSGESCVFQWDRKKITSLIFAHLEFLASIYRTQNKICMCWHYLPLKSRIYVFILKFYYYKKKREAL